MLSASATAIRIKNMAQAVDTCFARDVLAKYLDQIGKEYRPYEDFL